MEELATLQIERLHGVEAQIRDHVRKMIASGQIKSGAKLPPTEKLAGMWSAGSRTVQKALTPLVKEGLLIRRPKHGTFVQKREAKLTCVGIYKSAESADQRSLFIEAMQAALHEELAREGIRMEVWSDARPGDDRPGVMPTLERAITQRDIQALISLSASPFNYPWLGKLAVPVTYLEGGEPSAVYLNYRQFMELGLRALATQGCRSVGLIAPWPTVDFYETFTDLTQDLGLILKNPWVLVPSPGTVIPHERYGYEQFARLWNQAEHPEGLIVLPDSIARGVITRMLEQRVDVPGQLKLVLHKNESIDLLCPLPATFLVSSERALAQGLVAQVQKQFRGEQCEPVVVPFRQEAHPGGSQRETNQATKEGNRL